MISMPTKGPQSHQFERIDSAHGPACAWISCVLRTRHTKYRLHPYLDKPRGQVLAQRAPHDIQITVLTMWSENGHWRGNLRHLRELSRGQCVPAGAQVAEWKLPSVAEPHMLDC